MQQRRVRFFSSLALAAALSFSLAPARANPQLLVDINSGNVLLSHEAGLPWYPASLTKLTTAYVVFQAIERGSISLSTPVILSARAVAAPGGKSRLPVESGITMQDALNLLIVKSANDVAVAIAETVSGSVENFVAKMNEVAAGLEMNATNYVNPHGLFNKDQVTSARDLAVLALAIRRHFPQYASIFATSIVVLGESDLESNNNLLREFAGTTGMKTGFVCASGLNMVASVERGGLEVLAVVLGASSARERGELVAQMVSTFLAGNLSGGSGNVIAISNQTSVPAKNMRPQICGAQAKSYTAARQTEFPFGMQGQPSYLTDDIAPRTYQVRPLGRLRNVTLPRQRPAFAEQPHQTGNLEFVEPDALFSPVPLPRPRP